MVFNPLHNTNRTTCAEGTHTHTVCVYVCLRFNEGGVVGVVVEVVFNTTTIQNQTHILSTACAWGEIHPVCPLEPGKNYGSENHYHRFLLVFLLMAANIRFKTYNDIIINSKQGFDYLRQHPPSVLESLPHQFLCLLVYKQVLLQCLLHI